MGVRRSAAVAIGKLSRLRTRSLDRNLITFLLRVIVLAYVLVFCAISLKTRDCFRRSTYMGE
jgi:hypothetical protein